jgi:hypothetical protein
VADTAAVYRERLDAVGRDNAAAHRRRKSKRVDGGGLWKTEMNNLFVATLELDRNGRLREQRLNDEMVRGMREGMVTGMGQGQGRIVRSRSPLDRCGEQAV